MTLRSMWENNDQAEQIQRVLAETQTMANYFGTSLKTVSPLNLVIAVLASRPQWLQGVSSDLNIPRRMRYIEGYSYPLSTDIKIVAERVIWIVENLKGQWDIHSSTIIFENHTDAMAYHLTWDQN